MQRPNVLQRMNHHITATDCLQVDLSAPLPSSIPTQLHTLSSRSISALIAHRMVYSTSPDGEFCCGGNNSTGLFVDEFAMRPVSVWIVTDLSSEQGRLTTQSALAFLVWQRIVYRLITMYANRLVILESSLVCCTIRPPPTTQPSFELWWLQS